MEFGVPSKRRSATKEKYPNTPVITLLPFEGENTSRKFKFNPKTYEVMGLNEDDTNEVAFSFNKSNYTDNSIINANGFGIESALKLAKNSTISNKAHYEEVKNRYGAGMEDELELTIINSGKEFKGRPVFNLVTLESMQEAEKPASDSLADDEQPEEYAGPETGGEQEYPEDFQEEVVEGHPEHDEEDVPEMPSDEERAALDEKDEAQRKPQAQPVQWDSIEDDDILL